MKLEQLKKYVDAAAPSGFEHEAFDIMHEHLSVVNANIEVDNLGSLIASKELNNSFYNVMVAGHLDEIGFMITEINEDGYLKFIPLGGWWSQVMLAQQMTIVNKKGERFTGIIGAKPPHIISAAERDKVVEIKDMFIDLGVESKQEILTLGIDIGDFVVPYCEFKTMANEKFLLAKAFDNRIGCYIASEVFIKLYQEKLNVNLFAVGTVQEEVGLRGAVTASNFVKPSIGFSIDVGIAADMPGLESESFKGKLGDGPMITIFDGSMIAHRELRDYVVNIASKNNIKIQYSAMKGGGTDAGAMHISHIGCPSLALSIATRYIHSNVGILHIDDVNGAIDLLVSTIKSFNNDTIEKILNRSFKK